MSDLTDMQEAALEIIGELGTTCIVTVPGASVSNGGVVTESPVLYTVPCTDLVDESQRYGSTDTSQTIVGTLYLGGTGLGFLPAIGQRVTYQSRTLAVVAAFPYRLQGGVAAWRLDLAEVAGA